MHSRYQNHDKPHKVLFEQAFWQFMKERQLSCFTVQTISFIERLQFFKVILNFPSQTHEKQDSLRCTLKYISDCNSSQCCL